MLMGIVDMNKALVFIVYISPLEIALHYDDENEADRGIAKDEALRMIKNGEVEIDEVDFLEETNGELIGQFAQDKFFQCWKWASG